MLARRLLTFVASLFVCLAATATTVEQRSPFTQGHWWDPTRSGHGFELLNAGGQVFMVWYTYDENGAPTWYTAQGEESLLGNPWPLMRHEWSGGRISRSTSVGQAWLRRRNSERIDFVFEIGGVSGQWTIQPFRQSGVINEVDLTGHWYNPANNGWGMTLVDQGDVFGAVIYAYSASGAPTWVAGFDRGKGTRVDLYATRGTCPTCPYKAITSSAAGSINIDYRGDTEITIRGAPTVAFASGVVVDGTRAYQLGRPSSTRRVDFQLAPFGTSEALKSYIVAGLPGMSYGGSDFSAGGGGGGGGAPSFSETNLQESGVDEADVLKTDGTFVYSLVTTRTAGLANQVRIAHVGPGGSSLQAVGQFPVYEPPSLSQYQFSWAPGLYLHAGNLVTASTSATYWGGWYYSTAPSAETRVEIRSLASPAAPAVRWRGVLSGQYVGSRRVGDRLYVITRFSPNPASLPGYVAYPRTDADRAANAAVIAAAPVEAFLPTIKVDDGPALPAVIPSAIHAPQLGSNVQTSDMAVVTVIDVARAAVVDSLAIIGRTETLYVSTSNIYIASTRFNPSAMSSTVADEIPLYNTDIHQIRIDAERIAFAGSGSIEGTVGWGDKASFRFGEHAGKLAVLTSLNNGWWGANRNRLTILEPSAASPGLLKTISWLPNSRRPEPLGKPNEILYGTRFVGDKVYAVTFQRVDPLYAIDIANKADPRITGALEIPGFSDYLHPLPNGLMVGFGRDATDQGLMQGMQVALFDVSGATPRQIQKITIGERGTNSALFYSHHAVSVLPMADGSTRIAFPAAVVESGGGYGYSYAGLLHFDVRGATPAQAHLVQGAALVTHTRSPTYSVPYNIDAAYLGRSVLFPNASLYAGDGSLWLMNPAGVTGPY